MTAFNRAVEGLKDVMGWASPERERQRAAQAVLDAYSVADLRELLRSKMGNEMAASGDLGGDTLAWVQQDATPNTHRAVGGHYWQIMGEAAEREFNAGRPSDKKD